MGMAAYAGVLTSDGMEKRAEDFQAGDLVFEALTGQPLEVINSLNSPGVGMVRIMAEGDIILDLTGDHNILTDAGMVAAHRVAAGAGLRARDGFVKCTGVETLMGDYMVYDIQVVTEPGAEPWVVANGVVVEVRG